MALPENYVFTWHKANVRSISWLEDDIGFVSSAADNTIAVWLMPRIQTNGQANVPLWTYRCNMVNFTSTIGYKLPRDKDKDKDVNTVRISVFASGNDSYIHEIVEGKLTTKYELSAMAK